MDNIPDRYKTDLLILLIGENPLPNAVAAKLLLEEGGKVVLVHSATTREVANDLKNWLVRQGIDNYEFFEVAESDPVSIYPGVKRILIESKCRKAGLHYTGGTKAMAVHAYRAVEKWADEKNKEPVFSYLDARSLSMVIGPSNTDSGSRAEIYPVSTAVEIPLRAMIELNGWETLHPAATRPVLPETTKAIFNCSTKPAQFDEWVKAKNAMIGQFKGWSENQLQTAKIAIPDSPTLAPIRDAFRMETKCDPDGFTLGEATVKAFAAIDPSGWIAKQPAVELLTYFDGIWLENYIMQLLNSIKADCAIHSIHRDIETKGVQFQLDVTAIRGYQLFAISCTTMSALDAGDRADLKKKLFEVYIRARQLGGDEARIILVCMSGKPWQVEQALAEMLVGDTKNLSSVLDRRVKVFGQPDLADLSSKMKDWILKQSGA